MQKDPYKYFRIEAKELLDALDRGVLDLERPETAAGAPARLLRAAHTLKGSARVVRQGKIGELAHAFEEARIDVQRGERDRRGVALDRVERRRLVCRGRRREGRVPTPAAASAHGSA